MNTNSRRTTLLPAIAAVLMIASSANAQSTYFKYELCTADKYVNDGGAAIDQNFYKKYINAGPMPVLSSTKAPDAGLVEMANWIRVMTANLPAATIAKFAEFNVRAVLMDESEVTLDVPEHSHLDPLYNDRVRGLGATDNVPVTTAGAENVLNYGPGRDRYLGECIWVHELGHTIFDMAVAKADPALLQKLQDAYAAAMATGKYDNSYAATNYQEYWGEGSMAWFSCNARNPQGAKTRDEIKAFDPKLAEILAQVYGNNVPLYRDPDLALLEKSIVPCGSGLADVDGDGKNDVSVAPATAALSTMMGALSAIAAMLVM